MSITKSDFILQVTVVRGKTYTFVIEGGEDEGSETKDHSHGSVRVVHGGKDGTHDRDPGYGIGAGHQRRVQLGRHLGNELESEEGGQCENEE